jgi:hypothetical protein
VIHEKELAKRMLDLMEAISAQVNESIREVQQQCTEEEFKAYRRGAGRVMGYAFTDVMAPIYQEHPDLKPAGLL